MCFYTTNTGIDEKARSGMTEGQTDLLKTQGTWVGNPGAHGGWEAAGATGGTMYKQGVAVSEAGPL